MNEQHALNAFSVLSNATRLRMLKCLVSADSDGLVAGELAKSVGASPSRASFHLAAMSRAGLITSVRKSRQMVYSVNFGAVGELMRYLMQDCCQNNSIVLSCCNKGSSC